MIRRTLGRADLWASVIGLGAAHLNLYSARRIRAVESGRPVRQANSA